MATVRTTCECGEIDVRAGEVTLYPEMDPPYYEFWCVRCEKQTVKLADAKIVALLRKVQVNESLIRTLTPEEEETVLNFGLGLQDERNVARVQYG